LREKFRQAVSVAFGLPKTEIFADGSGLQNASHTSGNFFFIVFVYKGRRKIKGGER